MILFIGLLFLVIFTLLIGTLSGMVYALLDLASIIIVLAPLIFFLAVTKSDRIITGYIKSSFKKNYEYGIAELDSISMAARHSVRITLATGCFGFLIGIIGMLMGLDDPQSLGPTLAVALLIMLFSIGIGFFVMFPLHVWAENRKQAS